MQIVVIHWLLIIWYLKILEISRIIKIFKKILNKFLMSFLDNSREENQLKGLDKLS